MAAPRMPRARTGRPTVRVRPPGATYARNGDGMTDGGSGISGDPGERPPHPRREGAGRPAAAGKGGEQAPIRLGGARRSDTVTPAEGGPAPRGKRASGFGALKRAEERAQALQGRAAEDLAPGDPAGASPAAAGSAGSTGAPGQTADRSSSPLATPVGRSFAGRIGRPGSGRRRLSWGSPAIGFPRRQRYRRRRGAHRTRRRGSPARVVVRLVAAVAALVLLAGVFVVVQVTRPVPRPVLRLTAASTAMTLPGRSPSFPWPRYGEAAVGVAGFGPLGTAGPSAPVPIASLAKVMAAVVVLGERPLAPGQPGPSVALTAADQATYQADRAAGDSVAPVVAGESLSELQLLQALLVPSADNVAPVLARWEAGSEAAFVAKMNSTAAKLGMRYTHYADADGLSTATVSTASDQLRLAEVAAANPVLMSIVAQRQLALPDSPVLGTYDTALGVDGIVGIKTGSTAAAGGCFMFAADGTAAGRRVRVLGAVLGQRTTPWITSALNASAALIGPALASIRPVTVVPAGASVARVEAPWAGAVPVTTARAVTVAGVGGTVVRETVKVTAGRLPESLAAGSQVAAVTVSAGGVAETVPAVTARALPAPPLRWRLGRL